MLTSFIKKSFSILIAVALLSISNLCQAEERISLISQAKIAIPELMPNSTTLALGEQAVILGGFQKDLKAPELSDIITIIDKNASKVRQQKSSFELPALAAYCVKGSQIYCAGGVEKDGQLSDLLRSLDLSGKGEVISKLPIKVAGAALATYENKLYLIGGVTSLEPIKINSKVYTLDLIMPNATWQVDSSFPAEFGNRFLPIVATQNQLLHLFGGYDLIDGKLHSSKQIWRYKSGDWKDSGATRREDAPYGLGGANIIKIGVTHYGINKANKESIFDSLAATLSKNSKRQEMLIFSNVTEKSYKISLPKEATEAIAAVEMANIITGAGGRNISNPGILFRGNTDGYFYSYKIEKSSLNWLDYVLIAFYVGVLVIIGVRCASKTSNSSDYFVGGHKMPVWVASISAQAAGASGITMMALPAMAYQANLIYWGTLFWGIIPAILSAWVVIPILRKLNLVSCYEYLEARYCRGIRQFSSAMFLFSLLLLRLSSVTLLPAMAISAVTGANIYLCIIAAGLFATIYTVVGGINSVAFSDVFQFAIMTGGALLCVGMMVWGTDGGLTNFVSIADKFDKWTMFDFSWNYTLPTVWLCILTSPLTMFNSISDQGFVQRVMAVKDVREARKVTIQSFLWAIPVQSAMWIIGVGLFVFFYQNPALFDPTMPPDSSFPQFIVERLPAGIRGLLIIGIVAASLSTMNSGMNAAGALLTTDFFKIWHKNCTEKQLLFFSKFFTLVAGLISVIATLILATFQTGSLWELITVATALVMGGFPSIYMLGIMTKKGNTIGAVGGWLMSMVAVAAIRHLGNVSFIYYAPIALMVSFGTGYLISVLTGGSRKDLRGLTIFSRKIN